MEINYFNIWAIIVVIVIRMVLGGLWYSNILFGKKWLNLIGKTMDEISKEESNKAMSFAFIPAIVASLALWFILSTLNISSIGYALIVSAVISVGCTAMSHLNLILFEDRKVGLTLINVGYDFISLAIGGIILTIWQ